MKITCAICLGSALAGHLHHPETVEVQRVGYKSRLFNQGSHKVHVKHLKHQPHHLVHGGLGHIKHFHGQDSIDVKVIPTTNEDDKIVVDDGISTDSETFFNTEEIMLTDLVTIPEGINTLLEEEIGTISIELDATEDVDELPAKIAAALHAKAGDLINEKEVRDAIENVQKQLKDVTELLRTKAAAAAAKAQELNAKAQVAAAEAVERAKSVVGSGAKTLKEKAAEAQSAAADAAKKAQVAASDAIEKAKAASQKDGAAGSAVEHLKAKLTETAEKSKKAAVSVAEDVKKQAKSAAKSAAGALNDFAGQGEGEKADKRRLDEKSPSGTTIAAGSAGVGLVALASLGYVASRRRSMPSPPSVSPSVEAQQVDTLRDIAEGTFDMY